MIDCSCSLHSLSTSVAKRTPGHRDVLRVKLTEVSHQAVHCDGRTLKSSDKATLFISCLTLPCTRMPLHTHCRAASIRLHSCCGRPIFVLHSHRFFSDNALRGLARDERGSAYIFPPWMKESPGIDLSRCREVTDKQMVFRVYRFSKPPRFLEFTDKAAPGKERVPVLPPGPAGNRTGPVISVISGAGSEPRPVKRPMPEPCPGVPAFKPAFRPGERAGCRRRPSRRAAG